MKTKILMSIALGLIWTPQFDAPAKANSPIVFCYAHVPNKPDRFTTAGSGNKCTIGYQAVGVTHATGLAKTLNLIASSNFQVGRKLGQGEGFILGQQSQNGLPCIQGSASQSCSDGLTH